MCSSDLDTATTEIYTLSLHDALPTCEFGRCLADFGGAMPQVFDEQARHLGPMGPAAAALRELARSLRQGGNVLLVQGRPLCIGMTATRLALNAELFEKCAKAYVLAVAGGGRVQALPWPRAYLTVG